MILILSFISYRWETSHQLTTFMEEKEYRGSILLSLYQPGWNFLIEGGRTPLEKGMRTVYFRYRGFEAGIFRPEIELPSGGYPRMLGIGVKYKKCYGGGGKLQDLLSSFSPTFQDNRFFLFFGVDSVMKFIKTEGVIRQENNGLFISRLNLRIKTRHFRSVFTGGIWRDTSAMRPFSGLFMKYSKTDPFYLFGTLRAYSSHYISSYLSRTPSFNLSLTGGLGYRFPFINMFHAISAGIKKTGYIKFFHTFSYNFFSLRFREGFQDGGFFGMGGSLFKKYKFVKGELHGDAVWGANPEKRVSIGLFLSPSPYYSTGIRSEVKRNDINSSRFAFYLRVKPVPSLSTSFNLNFFNREFSSADFGLSFYWKSFSINMDISRCPSSTSLSFYLGQGGEIEKRGFGRVEGIVFYDENNNKKYDKGEPVVRGVRMVLDDKDTVKTDYSGRYKFERLAPGFHRVYIDLGNLPASYGARFEEKKFRVGWFDKVRIDFPITTLAYISGKVFYDRNENGRWDYGEEGVPNTVIYIKDTHYFTITDSKGDYILGNLLPGFYILGVRNLPPGYTLNPPDLLLYIYLRPGDRKKEMDIGIIPKKRPVKRKIFR